MKYIWLISEAYRAKGMTDRQRKQCLSSKKTRKIYLLSVNHWSPLSYSGKCLQIVYILNTSLMYRLSLQIKDFF